MLRTRFTSPLSVCADEKVSEDPIAQMMSIDPSEGIELSYVSIVCRNLENSIVV